MTLVLEIAAGVALGVIFVALLPSIFSGIIVGALMVPIGFDWLLKRLPAILLGGFLILLAVYVYQLLGKAYPENGQHIFISGLVITGGVLLYFRARAKDRAVITNKE